MIITKTKEEGFDNLHKILMALTEDAIFIHNNTEQSIEEKFKALYEKVRKVDLLVLKEWNEVTLAYPSL